LHGALKFDVAIAATSKFVYQAFGNEVDVSLPATGPKLGCEPTSRSALYSVNGANSFIDIGADSGGGFASNLGESANSKFVAVGQFVDDSASSSLIFTYSVDPSLVDWACTVSPFTVKIAAGTSVTGVVKQVALSPDATKLYYLTTNSFNVVDHATSSCVLSNTQSLTGLTGVKGFLVSPDSHYAYLIGNSTTGTDGNLWVVDLTQASLSAAQTITHTALNFTPKIRTITSTIDSGNHTSKTNRPAVAISPNGRFLAMADTNNTIHTFLISKGVPTDTTSALHNVSLGANRSAAGNRGASQLFGLLPANPVFTPVPKAAANARIDLK